MADQPEVIREEMAQTRTALTEKLEALEQHVLGTVESATSAVQETMGTMKHAVQETVGTVKDSIGNTVETVRETFDLELQTQRHPFAMVSAATCAGFVSGLAYNRLTAPTPPVTPGPVPSMMPDGPGRATTEPAFLTGVRERSSSLLSSLEPEIDKLKGLAVGAAFNVLKDLLQPYVPGNLKPQFTELVDNVTRRAGGNPVRGSIMEEWHRGAAEGA